MRVTQLKIVLLLLSLTSCSSFDKETIIQNREVYLEIFQIAISKNLTYSDANKSDVLSSFLRWNGIDRLEIKYQEIHEFMAIDSVVVYIKRSPNILTPEKRIIYDFAQIPRNIGDTSYVYAAYKRTQVDERWYFEAEGFD